MLPYGSSWHHPPPNSLPPSRCNPVHQQTYNTKSNKNILTHHVSLSYRKTRTKLSTVAIHRRPTPYHVHFQSRSTSTTWVVDWRENGLTWVAVVWRGRVNHRSKSKSLNLSRVPWYKIHTNYLNITENNSQYNLNMTTYNKGIYGTGLTQGQLK